MKIILDESIKDWAVNEVQKAWRNNEREGMHLSDLMTPRKKYWSKINPLPAQFHDICIWMSGNVFEDKFLRALDIQHGEVKEWNGIKYTPDIFFNFPCELKSRRRNLAKEGEEELEYDWYLKQLKGYCAVENKQQGWLIILSFVQKLDKWRTEPAMRFYRVEFTPEELTAERVQLLSTASAMAAAIETGDFKALPACPRWMCGRTISKIIKPPKCITCGREFQTERGLNKHMSSKKNASHMAAPAVCENSFEERCMWHKKCLPDLNK